MTSNSVIVTTVCSIAINICGEIFTVKNMPHKEKYTRKIFYTEGIFQEIYNTKVLVTPGNKHRTSMYSLAQKHSIKRLYKLSSLQCAVSYLLFCAHCRGNLFLKLLSQTTAKNANSHSMHFFCFKHTHTVYILQNLSKPDAN